MTKTSDPTANRAPRKAPEAKPIARLRLVFGPAAIVGPGRVELLELVAEHGSLAAAGRAMKMSYKRAWGLVDELNRTFDAPLVALTRGGSAHGGATLTPLGAEVVERYRRMQSLSDAAIDDDLGALVGRLAQKE
ncbi:winged helix-turn-helix domain-containing protein [Aureimonas mangrovi]|uniref:winged helix-turn-helix domain-containing protein n=1 Tax=Aureimonas mangrovi TaxID=2758041 RepID=UPI00163DD453|nr:winged helix-turn-helix domain-containing protein [Aureimonas mangrovi]